MPLLASIFTGNSKTKANIASKLKDSLALRQTKPIDTIPSALLLPWEVHSALEATLKIVPAKQRRFGNLIDDQSTLLHHMAAIVPLTVAQLDCTVDLLLELGLHLPDFLLRDV
jgi:hypothetical protein